MSDHKLPFSPSARAFFAALDGSQEGTKKNQSDTIKRRIQTLGWRNRYSQDETYPIQIENDSFQVRQVQRGEIDGTYGTGATVWPASIVLIKYLEQSGLLRGKHVVDLGAGTGVTSIAAALLGAKSCVCSDGEEPVVRLATENIKQAAQVLGSSEIAATKERENATNCTMIRDCPISTQVYWWGTGTIESENSCDIVLVSDCVLPKLYPIAPLVDALDQLLRSSDAAAYLSYEYRYFPEYDPKEKFVELCEAKDLRVSVIPSSVQHSVYSLDDVEIWKVDRPNHH